MLSRQNSEGLDDPGQGIAIGRRMGDHVVDDLAIGPRAVFDQYRLAPFLGQLGTDQPGRRVDTAPRRGGHQDMNRTVRKSLRTGMSGAGHDGGKGQGRGNARLCRFPQCTDHSCLLG